MPITVTPVDPTDTAAIEQAFTIVAAAVEEDLPDFPPACRRRFFATFTHPFPAMDFEMVLAYLDGVPAGCLRLELPVLDNTDNIAVDLDVHPAHRRRGIGRALYDYLVTRAGELGRNNISSMSVIERFGAPGPTPGAAFAAAMGASSALLDARRRLDTTSLDQPALDRLLSDAYPRAAGYSLLRWTGPTPDEYVDDIAYLEGRLVSDAPMGDLAWEPEKVDATRIRAIEAAREVRGRRGYHCAMRHDESGRLVAWTLLDVGESSPWHAFQQITLVDPEHRGHRLGTVVKVENLRYLMAHEPQVRAIDTFNAASNSYMIAINEVLGFRLADHWENWQVTL